MEVGGQKGYAPPPLLPYLPFFPIIFAKSCSKKIEIL